MIDQWKPNDKVYSHAALHGFLTDDSEGMGDWMDDIMASATAATSKAVSSGIASVTGAATGAITGAINKVLPAPTPPPPPPNYVMQPQQQVVYAPPPAPQVTAIAKPMDPQMKKYLMYGGIGVGALVILTIVMKVAFGGGAK